MPHGRLHSSLLIDESILIDAPPTTLVGLRQAGINPAQIEHLLITHWHGDHVFGFPFFILERKYISDRDGIAPLTVHTRRGGRGLLEQLCHLAFPGTMEGILDERVEWNYNHTSYAGQWQLERFIVEHEPLVFPHGYTLQNKDNFVITHFGDSGFNQEIIERSKSSNIVILEVGIPDGTQATGHHSPSDVINLSQTCPNTKFVLTHAFWSEHDIDKRVPKFPENVEIASDGWNMTFST